MQALTLSLSLSLTLTLTRPAATKMIAEMPDGTKKDMYDRYATHPNPNPNPSQSSNPG